MKKDRPHWIRGKYTEDDIRYNDSSYKCSVCSRVVDTEENYCPNCGARMVEPQESEDKDERLFNRVG